ncbi:MAG: ribosome-associated translation inhibitor RaiA [Thermomicrobiales bacterium]
MFDVRIHVQGSDNADTVADYIQERVDRLERFNERVTVSKFELRAVQHRTGGKQWVAQFTVQTPGRILRSEMRDHDQHHAVDVAVEKMRKQIRRFHTRKVKRSRRDSVNLGRYAAEQMTEADLPVGDADEEARVVRTKRFEFHPMDVEEAIDQMELLEHDFFVFRHSESGDTQVVYRRNDGSYGLIQPS